MKTARSLQKVCLSTAVSTAVFIVKHDLLGALAMVERAIERQTEPFEKMRSKAWGLQPKGLSPYRGVCVCVGVGEGVWTVMVVWKRKRAGLVKNIFKSKVGLDGLCNHFLPTW